MHLLFLFSKDFKTMTGRFLAVIVLCIWFVSCGENSGEKRSEGSSDGADSTQIFQHMAQQDFLGKFSGLCGKTYVGKEYFRSQHAQSWAAKKLSIQFKVCNPDAVRIEFLVDENPPITWILAAENRKLKLMHEHLDASGELLPGSMYGGLATDQGTANIQYFPADEYTGKIMEGASENIWILSLAEDFTWFSYRLDRDKERRFEYRFDLTNALD